MTSADSLDPEFDDWLLAYDGALAGERSDPLPIDAGKQRIKRKLDAARRCLELLDLSRQCPPIDCPINASKGPSLDEESDLPQIPRFSVIRKLGAGGFGDVYLAEDLQLHRSVAIKLVHTRYVKEPNALARFQRELIALGSLRHPSIVSVFESGVHGSSPYLVMEYCDSGTLSDFLLEAQFRMPIEVCARIIYQIADGLAQAHSIGILHRDIKPHNILMSLVDPSKTSSVYGNDKNASLQTKWDDLKPKLTDFGLAKLTSHEVAGDLTISGTTAGTPQYMAPEQAAGRPDLICAATDVHGLGVTLYEMITGRHPFLGDTPLETRSAILNKEPLALRALRPSIPRDLETICHKALQKEPVRRYHSAREMADDLIRYLNDQEILAKPVTLAERAQRWCRHHPELFLLLAVTFVSLSLLLLGGWAYSHQLKNAVQRESLLAESERGLRADAEKREARLIAQAQQLEETAYREQLHSYTSQMRLSHELYQQGREVECATLLSTLSPQSPSDPDLRDFSWGLLTHFCQGTLTLMGGTISSDYRTEDLRFVTVIPQKHWIVAGTNRGTVQAWDISSRKPVVFPAADTSSNCTVTGIGFHHPSDSWYYSTLTRPPHQPDSAKLIRWSSNNGTVELSSSRIIWSFSASRDYSRMAMLFRGDSENGFRVFSMATGKHLWTAPSNSDVECQVGWSSLGELAVPESQTVAVYDVDGRLISRLVRSEKDMLSSIRSCCFSDDNKWLACLTADLAVDLWSRKPDRGFEYERRIQVPTDRQMEAVNTDRTWFGIRFIEQDSILAFCGPEHRVYLWDLERACKLCNSLSFGRPVSSIHTLPQGNLLLHVSEGPLYHWRRALKQPNIHGHAREAWSVEFSPTAGTLASGSDDETVKIWEMPTGRELMSLPGHTATVVEVRYSPKGDRLATLCLDGSIRIWAVNTTTGLPMGEPSVMTGHRKGRCLCWSSDGRSLASGGYDGEVVIWNADRVEEVGTYHDHRTTVRQLLWLDQDLTLLSVSNDEQVVQRSLTERETPLRRWNEDSEVHSVSHLAQSDEVALGLRSGVICIRNRKTGHCRSVLVGHRDRVRSMAVSPDGKVLASGDESGMIRLWRVENQQLLLSLQHSRYSINGLRFSPLGDSLAIATHDGKVTVWQVEKGD